MTYKITNDMQRKLDVITLSEADLLDLVDQATVTKKGRRYGTISVVIQTDTAHAFTRNIRSTDDVARYETEYTG